jgi:hypothetical protein
MERSKKRYFKIIGHNCNEYEYKLGLNELLPGETFDKPPECGPGGLYYTDKESVLGFLNRGNDVAILTVPDDAQQIQVYGKLKSDKINIIEILSLKVFDTIRLLCEKNEHGGEPSMYVKDLGLHRVTCSSIKYHLKKFGALLLAERDKAIDDAIAYGDIKDLKRVSSGYSQHRISKARTVRHIRSAIKEGHLDMLKYLHTDLEWSLDIGWPSAVVIAAEYGQLDILDYLYKKGFRIHKHNYRSFRGAAATGQLRVVKYLREHGADVHANNDEAIDVARRNRHMDVVEYLQQYI